LWTYDYRDAFFNEEQQRGNAIRKRTNQEGYDWHFGMKAHIGVDSRTKISHSVAASAANVHDSLALPVLLHGKESCVWG
jgi:transposase, IS5 family